MYWEIKLKIPGKKNLYRQYNTNFYISDSVAKVFVKLIHWTLSNKDTIYQRWFVLESLLKVKMVWTGKNKQLYVALACIKSLCSIRGSQEINNVYRTDMYRIKINTITLATFFTSCHAQYPSYNSKLSASHRTTRTVDQNWRLTFKTFLSAICVLFWSFREWI